MKPYDKRKFISLCLLVTGLLWCCTSPRYTEGSALSSKKIHREDGNLPSTASLKIISMFTELKAPQSPEEAQERFRIAVQYVMRQVALGVDIAAIPTEDIPLELLFLVAELENELVKTHAQEFAASGSNEALTHLVNIVTSPLVRGVDKPKQEAMRVLALIGEPAVEGLARQITEILLESSYRDSHYQRVELALEALLELDPVAALHSAEAAAENEDFASGDTASMIEHRHEQARSKLHALVAEGAHPLPKLRGAAEALLDTDPAQGIGALRDLLSTEIQEADRARVLAAELLAQHAVAHSDTEDGQTAQALLVNTVASASPLWFPKAEQAVITMLQRAFLKATVSKNQEAFSLLTMMQNALQVKLDELVAQAASGEPVEAQLEAAVKALMYISPLAAQRRIIRLAADSHLTTPARTQLLGMVTAHINYSRTMQKLYTML